MPSVECPYCGNEFEWTKEMGDSRVECPRCNKTMTIVRRKGKAGTEVELKAITSWGTDGFRSEQTRAAYGETKKGDVLGGFRIEEVIGAGAMAVVYKATQLSLDRTVALKILPKEFAKKPAFVRQFDSETDLLAALNHPSIVSIIDRGREGETYFFAMEYVEGTTLGELLATRELDEESFLRVVEQCAEALGYAHSRGVIHRDIKPANIMLNDQGLVKVADFGVAGLVAEERARRKGKRKVMGTRGYMAPEQEVDVSQTDERSDIFSLGAVMYRMLTDRIPDQLPPVPPSGINPEVDPRLGRLVLTCLEVSPARRYQSAEELLEAIRAFQREITRAEEVCPECKKQNPLAQKTCLHCGADLSRLFDVCPECGAENRIDVEVCMGCGTSLSQLRQQTAVLISNVEGRARRLAGQHDYEQAIAQLELILGVKGKVFQRARDKARRLIEGCKVQRVKYYTDRMDEGKRLAVEGRLSESLELLQPVPEELAERAHVASFIERVRSSMDLAKKKVAAIPAALEEGRYEEVEKAIGDIAQAWVDCPGLEEARAQLEGSRETEKMLEYELGQVRQLLQDGEFLKAREALEFAAATMLDDPRVKKLAAVVDRAEKGALFQNVVAEARKVFEQGKIQDAIRYWTEAGELLPRNDGRQEKLKANITRAQHKLREAQEAQRRAMQRARAEDAARAARRQQRTRTLAVVLLVMVAAVVLIGGIILYLLLTG